jgi:hypothetical protein
MARAAPPCLRHNTTSTLAKLSWEKARAKSLYHPAPVPAASYRRSGNVTTDRQASHGKTVNGHVFFVGLVFTPFVKCCQAFLFEKRMENIVFLEGIRGEGRFCRFRQVPPLRRSMKIQGLQRESVYALSYFQNSNTEGISIPESHYRLFGLLPFREWIRSTGLRCAAFPGKDADWKSSPRRDSDARSAENLFCW